MSDETEPTWVYDDAARARVASELAVIEQAHAHLPACVVCGQRCIRLDKAGCCSKLSSKSEPHRAHREEMRHEVQA